MHFKFIQRIKQCNSGPSSQAFWEPLESNIFFFFKIPFNLTPLQIFNILSKIYFISSSFIHCVCDVIFIWSPMCDQYNIERRSQESKSKEKKDERNMNCLISIYLIVETSFFLSCQSTTLYSLWPLSSHLPCHLPSFFL